MRDSLGHHAAKVGKFDSYIEIADSWERLLAGSFVEQDLDLLSHECLEPRFETLYRTDLFLRCIKYGKNCSDKNRKRYINLAKELTEARLSALLS